MFSIAFKLSENNGSINAEFAVCNDTLEFARRAIESGVSVYQGAIGHQGRFYQYVIEFSGLEHLVHVQTVCGDMFKYYIKDMMNEGKAEYIEMCLVPDDKIHELVDEMQ